MKKLMLVLVIFAVIGSTAFALDLMSYPPSVEGGNIMVDIGAGLILFPDSGSSWKIPPLFAQVEYALPISVPISVGASFAFYQWERDYGIISYTLTGMYFLARGNWHWGFPIEWLDLYTGVSVGYELANIKWDTKLPWYDPSYGGFAFGGQVGAHFYFTKMLGAMVEAGYPFLIKAGVSLKF